MEVNKNFPAKIMLFGEYGVIKNADSLLIPFSKFSGHFEITGLEVDQSLWKLYLSISSSRILAQDIDMERIKADLNNGLRFVSSIPQGMGLGSSGALCSALFDRYKRRKIDDIALLQEHLSIMESHFHGRSSGVDPIASYLGQAIYVNANKDVQVLDKLDLSSMGNFYLLNSKIQRHTAPLVHSFLSDYSTPSKAREYRRFMEVSNNCIQNIFDKNQEKFMSNFFEISKLQREYFSKMIPKSIIELWEYGLSSGDYYLKLCGAGGGGFFICYSKKEAQLDNLTSIIEFTVE